MIRKVVPFLKKKQLLFFKKKKTSRDLIRLFKQRGERLGKFVEEEYYIEFGDGGELGTRSLKSSSPSSF